MRNPTLHDSAKPLSWYSCSGLDGLLWVGVVGDKPTKRGGGGCLVYRVSSRYLVISTLSTWVEPSVGPSLLGRHDVPRRSWAVADVSGVGRNGTDRGRSCRLPSAPVMRSSSVSTAVCADGWGSLGLSDPTSLVRYGGRQPGKPCRLPGTAAPR